MYVICIITDRDLVESSYPEIFLKSKLLEAGFDLDRPFNYAYNEKNHSRLYKQRKVE